MYQRAQNAMVKTAPAINMPRTAAVFGSCHESFREEILGVNTHWLVAVVHCEYLLWEKNAGGCSTVSVLLEEAGCINTVSMNCAAQLHTRRLWRCDIFYLSPLSSCADKRALGISPASPPVCLMSWPGIQPPERGFCSSSESIYT